MRTQLPPLSQRICPFSDCPSRQAPPNCGPASRLLVRKGRYYRREDSQWIPRFRCLRCQRSFSSSRLTPRYRQKRRRLNHPLYELLCSGVSQRRAARLLKADRKTIVRRFLWLAEQARAERLKELQRRSRSPETQIPAVYFDEMESSEHSKCLPLSIPLVVEPQSRKILGFRVARMPAKGPLARLSRRKYGDRPDERPALVAALWGELQPLLSAQVRITSDQNPQYPGWIKRHFPQAHHETVKGQRGCVAGQGELKRVVYDPLFSLNHTAAMIRANVNRMFRRTWCTTKRRDRLEAHLEIYAHYHNHVLTA